MDKSEYRRRARQMEPPRPIARNAFWAFVVGGIICVVGQGVMTALLAVGYTTESAKAPTAVIMVFLGSLLTAVGLYDRITSFAGMGGALPITGFANAVVAPAIEFRNEGAVLGTGARIFQVAGPIIAYGMLAAFVVGAVRLALQGVWP